MEILVAKIVSLDPSVLLVGKAVCRQAQELFLKSNIVYIQHVKPSLMTKVSRQTGATILSSTDHVMTQFGTRVLGKCRRFRLLTFRDHEKDVKRKSKFKNKNKTKSSDWTGTSSSDDQHTDEEIDRVVYDSRGAQPPLPNFKDITNNEKQSILAASRLGPTATDGSLAVTSGLAKRGVARTFVMLEGTPKDLGCTVILRGASEPALKQIKSVLELLIDISYNLRLETSYLTDRCASVPSTFASTNNHLLSSSLCVDYGKRPGGRNVKPWSGNDNTKGVKKSYVGHRLLRER